MRLNMITAGCAVSLVVTLGVTGCGGDESERHFGAPTAEQEVALGLQAAPALAEKYGGLLDAPEHQRLIDALGEVVAAHADATGLPFGVDFHVLADSVTEDVLSLPGGQVFITVGMLRRLGNNLPGVAALLAHELGHVTARHAVMQISEQRFEGQTGGAVLARYSPEDERSRSTASVQAVVAALLDISHSEAAEIDADRRGIEYLTNAVGDTVLLPDGTRLTGIIDPGALAAVLQQMSESRGTGQRGSHYMTRHPVTPPRLTSLQATLNRPSESQR